MKGQHRLRPEGDIEFKMIPYLFYLRIQGKDDGELTGGEAIQGLRLTAGIVVGVGG